MSLRIDGPADLTQKSASSAKIITLAVIFGVAGVTLFAATEAIAAAAISAWAFAGLFHLGDTVYLGILAVFLMLALGATAKVAQMAWAAETHPDNN